MIVYGDPSFRASQPEFVARVRDACAAAAADPSPDRLRSLLALAGQLEQAVADAHDADPRAVPAAIRDRAAAATDAAAEALVACGPSAARAALARAAARLAAAGGDADLRIKVPEGFAFYALFPEQYRAAARLWHRDHAGGPSPSVLVLGLRSIGTTLSAVVAAELAARGWRVRRATARPSGHPFDRRVHLPDATVAGATLGIVVDEGPGASGSSMAAAAAALAASGFPDRAISFMPGHAAAPGPMAGEATRAWWERARRYVAPPEGPEWGPDGSFAAVLARATPGAGPVPETRDIGAGRWRRADSAAHDGSIATPLFERPKHLVDTRGNTRVLWAFGGFAQGDDGADGASRTLRRCTSLAAGGWTVAPVGCVAGFVGFPWQTGTRLRREDLTPGLADRIGRYIAAAAGPALTPDESAAAIERVRGMAAWNVKVALGETASHEAEQRLGAAAAVLRRGATPSAGDGRLGPWEWIRRGDGSIVKVDCGGHDRDHTIVGPQPLVWDVAGAAVEWAMPEDAAGAVLRAAGAGEAPPDAARALRIGYAALRLGQCEMCLGAASDPDDQRMLSGARGFYTDALRRSLADHAGTR